MVSLTSTFINERGSLPKLLLTGAACGRGNNDGEEAVWSPANRSKTKGFFQVPRTQLEQKQGLGNRKVWRSEVLTTEAWLYTGRVHGFLGASFSWALCLLSPTTPLSQRSQNHIPSCSQTVTFDMLVTKLPISLGWYLCIFLSLLQSKGQRQ